MKNSKRACLLLLPSLLIGCAGEGGGSSLPSTPDFYETMAGRTKDAEYIYDYLTHIGNHGNYTLSYTLEGVECYDLFNPSYYYTSILRSGGVLLPYVEEPAQNILYRFEMSDEGVEILLPETSGYGIVEDVNDISFFSLFVDEDDPRYQLKEDAIKKRQDGVFYTDDPMANLVLCASVGYIGLAQNGLIKDTTFSFTDKGDVVFSINALSLDAEGNYQEALITKATISDVDRSEMPEVDRFISSYAQGEALEESAATVLLGETLSAHNEVTLHEGNETPVPYAVSDVGISPNELIVRSKEAGSDQVYAHFFENQGGKAKVIGIDGHNQVVVEDGGVAWNELGWPKDFFSAKAFRKIDDNVYRYLGLDAEGLFYSYSYLNFEMAIKTLDLVVENGSLKEMHATFYRSVAEEDSSFSHFTVKTTFSSKAEFARPAPYDGKGEEATQEKIAKAFSNLKAGSSYVALKEDYGSLTTSVTKMTLADDILYFEVYNPVTTETSKAYGFLEKEGQIIPFNVHRDPETNRLVPEVSGKCVPGDTLDNHIGFSVSPLVFSINEKNQIVPKPEVLSLQEGLILGEGGPFMIPSTLTMQLDGEGHIISLNYRYEAPLGNGQGFIRGYDQISFKDYGTAALPPNLTRLIRQLTPKE